MAGFTPLQDKVLVKPDSTSVKTPGGIIIVDSAQEKPHQGTVIAVGAGRRTESGALIPTTVKPGDKVMYGKYDGTDIKVEGVDHVIMSEDQIVGIIN